MLSRSNCRVNGLLALESGLEVTALDGLFWFGIQRIAADIQRLRKAGMRIVTSERDVFDTLTGTTRRIPVYRAVMIGGESEVSPAGIEPATSP